ARPEQAVLLRLLLAVVDDQRNEAGRRLDPTDDHAFADRAHLHGGKAGGPGLLHRRVEDLDLRRGGALLLARPGLLGGRLLELLRLLLQRRHRRVELGDFLAPLRQLLLALQQRLLQFGEALVVAARGGAFALERLARLLQAVAA